MKLSDFDFDLPEDRIALRPAEPRDAARMLVVRQGDLEDRQVSDLPAFLRPGDALVLNDTRVIPSRLEGQRDRDGVVAGIEVTLHKREGASRWRAFARPGRKLQPGDRLWFGHSSTACSLGTLEGTVAEKSAEGDIVIAFDLAGPDLDLALATIGRLPLPPYIEGRRAQDMRDLADYQTLHARHDGAVAAPTAGLHFTPTLLEAVAAAGVALHFVTLHVGAGTFLPVKSENLAEHRMHAEWGTVPHGVAEALNAVRARGGRIVAVGTTSLRLLESAATPDGVIQPFSGDTDIFITPGYRFRAVDLLMTNFHLPKSTLFMLVSAFAGLDAMRAAYAHAVAAGYRFYSYGDSSLLFRSSDA